MVVPSFFSDLFLDSSSLWTCFIFFQDDLSPYLSCLILLYLTLSSPPFSLSIHNRNTNTQQTKTESHVQLLQDAKQPIPQTVALLLAEARIRKENKSTCNSRARKNTLVEEMTCANARTNLDIYAQSAADQMNLNLGNCNDARVNKDHISLSCL